MGLRMKTYRGFLFDADNTLFDYDRAEGEALTETVADVAPAAEAGAARSLYRAINDGYWKRFEQGQVTLATLKIGRFEDFLAALGATADAVSVSDRYLARLAKKAYMLPHARQMLEQISRVAAVGLVTNGLSIVQRGRLAASGLGPLFSSILISEELGVAKPDRRFFEEACKALRLDPSEILCIGDGPVTDVEGARSAGIDACWYAPSGAVWPGPGSPPALVAHDLLEIVKFSLGVFPQTRF
jgi:2-haloacid dehalogenase